MTTPDPILAAIEKHRCAYLTFEASTYQPDEAKTKAALKAEDRARAAMHRTIPQTVAGFVAYVTYWSRHVTEAPAGPANHLLEEEGWEAIPTIAEACRNLLHGSGA